jgi:hypothetical protein
LKSTKLEEYGGMKGTVREKEKGEVTCSVHIFVVGIKTSLAKSNNHARQKRQQ